MTPQPTNSEQLILDLLQDGQIRGLEEVVTLLPELSWSQIFTTIDRLSRGHKILLLRKGFEYEIACMPSETPRIPVAV